MNLQAAIRAVRDESLERGAGPRTTRGRVLASIERSPRRRVHAVVAALIASMFGATAFAWYARTPQPRPSQPLALTTDNGTLAPIEQPRPAERTVAHVDLSRPAAAPPHAGAALATKAVVAPAVPARAPEPARDPLLALYATAHAFHFQQGDMVAALAAWDRYLAAAPDGSLAPEARFNRLVALVKLERWDDARKFLATIDDTFRPGDIARLRAFIAEHRR